MDSNIYKLRLGKNVPFHNKFHLQVNLPVLTRQQCKNMFDTRSIFFTLSQSQLCAGRGKKDTCEVSTQHLSISLVLLEEFCFGYLQTYDS